MKILLIDPPFYRILGFYNRYFPSGLVTLATFLRQQGYPDVQVYDADFNEQPTQIDYAQLPRHYQRYLNAFQEPEHPVWKEMETVIGTFRPDIAGISVWTTFAAAAFFTAAIAKRVNPTGVVVMGGPHATVKADEILRICPDADYVIRGEGEQALLELVAASKGKTVELRAIAGLSFRDQGRIVHNPLRTATVDPNRLPFPDRTLLRHEQHYTAEDMGLIMTTRGCPYACTYCATNTKRVSYRATEHILAEIRSVRARYGAIQFTFKDDSFTVNRGKVAELCRALLREKLRIAWECNTRVNLVDEALLRLMKKSGCNFIKVGIESGSEAVLKRMNKRITHAQVRAAAALFRKVGIHWTGYFMMGVPGETEDDIRKTWAFVDDVRPDFACIGVYEPFPGTAMFAEGVERGLFRPEMTLADFYAMLPNHYYKQDSERQTDLIAPERFKALEADFKAKLRRYNRRPSRIVKMGLARVRAYGHKPATLWEDFGKFLRY